MNVDVAATEVRFALNVDNVGKKHVELSFPNGKSYDFVVVDSLGREVWHWSKGRMFTQGVQNKQLGTGDVMHVSEAWKRPLQPGTLHRDRDAQQLQLSEGTARGFHAAVRKR